jgi:non-ribosomal peptide synthetase component F
MWFVEQLVPGEPVHNLSFERRYAGHLDPEIMRAAVADVVVRHESLHTRFVARDSTLWQVIEEPPRVPPVEFTDLSAAADPRAAFGELCERAGTEVFDLGRAPLLRIEHVRLDADTDGLVIVVHHAVADAISTEILVRDLTAAYEHRLTGRVPDWPELPVQYADFTAWQEERADSPAAHRDLEHWRTALADLSTLDLTCGRPRPEPLSQRGRMRELTLDDDVVSALEAFVRTERATAFMGLLAAYAATLGRVFGSEDVVVASPVAGRPLPELSDVIGMFVDQVVLRLDLSEGPTFRELVGAARRVVGEAHDHDSVTFDQIVTAVAPERVAGVTPLAQAAINLQPPVPPRPPAGRMPRATDASQIDTGTATHDLLLELVPARAPEPFTGVLRYRADVVDDAAAELVCTVLPRLLRLGLASPDRPLWTFQDLWPEPAPAAPVAVPDTTLHELLGTLSHEDPTDSVNRVAHALRARGVGRGDAVLVALPPSPALVLGVLTAGAVYVPADPAAPTAPLAERSGARVTITDLAELRTDAVAGPPPVAVGPDDVAFLLFASGSPVVVSHRNAVAAAQALLAVLDGPSVTETLGALLAFDSAVDGSTLYGCAETGPVALGAEPLPGVRAYVLDEWGAPVPPGCLGELWVGGPQVASGYLGAPGATAAVFGPDPAGGRRFRTGERVRLLADGRLEFPRGADEPVAVTSAGPQEPCTPVEETLLDGWQWLLPSREFGVTDDFFDIGGDSILAIHAVSEARRHGLTLTVRQILDLRTIRALAAALDTAEPAGRAAPLGVDGPTVIRLPAPPATPPTIPGITVDGDVLTADPSQVDDWSVARTVRGLCTHSTMDDDALGLLVPRETMAALAGPTHEAYATTTLDLVVAATLAATGAEAVAVADTRREEPSATGANAEPGLLRAGPATTDAELIQAVKSALHSPAEDDPAAPGVRVLSLPAGARVTAVGDAGARVLVTLAGARLIVTGDAAPDLPERIRGELTRLVDHCATAETVYSTTDFPDAGLDEATMAGLLAVLDSEAAP